MGPVGGGASAGGGDGDGGDGSGGGGGAAAAPVGTRMLRKKYGKLTRGLCELVAGPCTSCLSTPTQPVPPVTTRLTQLDTSKMLK